MAFRNITIEGFEGPLDLLLELIERERLDITHVSLAQVADQYLGLLQGAEGLTSEELAEFLVVASRLILIKSRRLFPQFALTEEEEEDANILERQLREYQRYRNAARLLSDRWAEGRKSFFRSGYMLISSSFFPPPGVTVGMIRTSYATVLGTLPVPKRKQEEIVRRIVTLEERIEDLQERIRGAVVTSFREHVGKGANKVDVVVSFLALLHLIKQSIVDVEQKSAFHDILIRRTKQK